METTLDRIKMLTHSKGITVAELERRANLGNGTIRRWDSSVPAVDKLHEVTKILGTTMEYILTGEEDLEIEGKILARKVGTLSDNQLSIIKSMIEEFDKQNNK